MSGPVTIATIDGWRLTRYEYDGGFTLIVMSFPAEQADMFVAGLLTALIATAALVVEAAFTFPDAPNCRLAPSALAEKPSP